MAKAIAECKCSKCGATFTKTAIKYNREQADSWKAWAEENCKTCPDCWKQEQDEAGKELAAEYNLPQITGVSEKQIAYAESLRARYLTDSEHELKQLSEMLHELHTEHQAEFEAMLAKLGQSEAEYLAQRTRKMGLGKAYTLLTTGESRQIIDALNNY